MKLILDSNVFDTILDDEISIEFLNAPGIEVFYTHVQKDELSKCTDKEKRERLLEIFSLVGGEKLSTESFVLDNSRLGEAKLGDGEILKQLRKENFKHTKDALIGEVAIKNQLVLVTNDRKLRNKVKALGGNALSVAELKST